MLKRQQVKLVYQILIKFLSLTFIENLTLIMKFKNFYIVFLLFIVSTLTTIAQTNNKSLQSTWENPKQSDSIRFNALAEFYVLNNQVQPDSTLKVLDYYYQLAKEKNNAKELYNVANDRGGIYRLKGELDIAFNYYNEAEKFAEKLNDSVLIATILGNKGNVYANKKDYNQALQCFSNSYKFYKTIKDKKGESNMLSSIGNVYLYIQDYDLALEYYQKALSTIQNVDVPKRRIAIIYLNIGWTNYEIKKYEEAKIYYDKALKILEITNDKFFLVSGYSTLAKIHLELNELKQATEYAEKNSIICKELKVSSYIIDNQTVFARLDFKKGNIEAAKKKGESILAGLDKNVSTELKLNIYDLLYKVYLAENNSKKSLEMYQKYSIYKDSIQLEKNKLTLVREVVKNEFDDLILKNDQKLQKEKAALESKQQQKTYGIILGSIVLIVSIIFYFNRNIKKNRNKSEELLEEIKKLKSDNKSSIVITPNEFELVREKIEQSINRKLNETDWIVLNILLKEPDISNKEIAEKAFMSVDGIGSSLRRMYVYFDIKETKYKKITLIREAIKISTQ